MLLEAVEEQCGGFFFIEMFTLENISRFGYRVDGVIVEGWATNGFLFHYRRSIPAKWPQTHPWKYQKVTRSAKDLAATVSNRLAPITSPVNKIR